MELSVVVPVLNEAGNIGPLVAEIDAALDGVCEFEMIFIDDGSEDATAAELAAACRRHRRLRVVRHLKRCGQSTALRSGVRAARGAWIATLDGDGQNDPADIPRLLGVAQHAGEQASALLVAGYRRQRRDSLVKRYSSRIANAVRARILSDATPDTGCGLKVFKREDFLSLPYFDHMHRFLPALFGRAGGEVQSVEVNHRHRMRGRSKYGTLDRLVVGVVDLLGVMWLQRRSCIPEIVHQQDDNDALE
jgi:dolichol-phosphate mannosyltransferase